MRVTDAMPTPAASRSALLYKPLSAGRERPARVAHPRLSEQPGDGDAYAIEIARRGFVAQHRRDRPRHSGIPGEPAADFDRTYAARLRGVPPLLPLWTGRVGVRGQSGAEMAYLVALRDSTLKAPS